MIQHSLMKALLIGALFVGTCEAATAGPLFPPENAPGGKGACDKGEALAWTGESVVCQNPTKGVKLACPSGQVLTGVDYGKPVCESLTTAVNISCPSGQVLRGISNGQALCETMTASTSSSSSSSTTSSSTSTPAPVQKKSCNGGYGAASNHGEYNSDWRVTCAWTKPCVAGKTQVTASEVLCNDGTWVFTGRTFTQTCIACFVTENK